MNFKIQSNKPKFGSNKFSGTKSFKVEEHETIVVKKAQCIYGHKDFKYLKEYYYIEVKLSNPGRIVLYFYPEMTLDNHDIKTLAYEVFTPDGVGKYFNIYYDHNQVRTDKTQRQ